jgi:hypothetical protein
VGEANSQPLANTVFVVKRGDEKIISFTTEHDGSFRVSLLPGHYTISKKEPAGKLGHYGPFEIEVVTGQMTKVQWTCDTGMR